MNRYLSIALTAGIICIIVHSYNNHYPATQQIADTIYTEAGGEPYLGKLAVATTIFNRAQLTSQSPLDIVNTPKQYCRRRTSFRQRLSAEYHDCLELATALYKMQLTPLDNWTHFYAYKKSTPYWASTMTNKKVIGNHVFGKVK